MRVRRHRLVAEWNKMPLSELLQGCPAGDDLAALEQWVAKLPQGWRPGDAEHAATPLMQHVQAATQAQLVDPVGATEAEQRAAQQPASPMSREQRFTDTAPAEEPRGGNPQ